MTTSADANAALPGVVRKKIFLYELVILASGVILGVSCVLIYQGLYPAVRSSGRKPDAGRIAARIQEKYELDDTQKTKVTEIFTQHFNQLEELRNSLSPQLDQQYESLKTEMRKVLTPEQFSKWEPSFEERRQRYKSNSLRQTK